eukprot:12822398-Ditylum_brightwellii.AAC.1
MVLGIWGGRKPVESDVPYHLRRIQYFWIAKIGLIKNLPVGPLSWAGVSSLTAPEGFRNVGIGKHSACRLTWDKNHCPCLSHPVLLHKSLRPLVARFG